MRALSIIVTCIRWIFTPPTLSSQTAEVLVGWLGIIFDIYQWQKERQEDFIRLNLGVEAGPALHPEADKGQPLTKEVAH
jgi:hypothetical protein